MLKDLWTVWRGDNRKWKKLRKAKNTPQITARKPRREHITKNSRALGPRQDRTNRVTRPLTQPHPRHVPRLRGGGPDPSQEGTTDHVRNEASDRTFLDGNERVARTQRLVDRLQGCWRGGEMPTDEQIQDRYLVPNNWNVNAAHRAAIESLNQELERPVELAPAQSNQAGEPPQTHPFVQVGRRIRNEDPFTDSDVSENTRPSSVLYTLSSYRGRIKPFGRRGFRALPTSPSPPPRRRGTAVEQQFLDPVLPAFLHPLQAEKHPAGVIPFPPTTVGAVFTSVGLPDPIKIWEELSDEQEPPPAHKDLERSSPAPNQDHQRQIERQGQGLPPQGTNDNDSNQENQSPRRTNQDSNPTRPQQIQPSLPPSQPQVQTQQPRCQDLLCHPCPRYSGLFHHICLGQATQPQRRTQSPRESDGQRSILRWYEPTSPDYNPTSPPRRQQSQPPPPPTTGDTIPVLSSDPNPNSDGDNRPPFRTLESNPTSK